MGTHISPFCLAVYTAWSTIWLHVSQRPRDLLLDAVNPEVIIIISIINRSVLHCRSKSIRSRRLIIGWENQRPSSAYLSFMRT